jgi:hypothetical protein
VTHAAFDERYRHWAKHSGERPSGWPAHTGRRLVIRFEGHYHGWQDTVYWSNHVDPGLVGPASRPRPVPSCPGVPAKLWDELGAAHDSARLRLYRVLPASLSYGRCATR